MLFVLFLDTQELEEEDEDEEWTLPEGMDPFLSWSPLYTNNTAAGIAMLFAPRPFNLRSGNMRRALDVPLINNWFHEHCPPNYPVKVCAIVFFVHSFRVKSCFGFDDSAKTTRLLFCNIFCVAIPHLDFAAEHATRILLHQQEVGRRLRVLPHSSAISRGFDDIV